MTTQLELSSPLAPPLPLRRFTVAQYHQLGELGVLTPEDNVELLEGWIVEKINQRPIHGFIVRFLAEWFQSHLPEGYLIQCQLPVTTQTSEPEPDIALVKGTHQDYRDRHPAGSDCRLVIEVADTSVERDRAKAAIYRAAGVEEYWIVNISSGCVEQYVFSASEDGCESIHMSASDRLAIRLADSELVVDLKQILE